jgi:nitroimidazol reductase NimA-like FMN-containing flavoprotein (pyridoxamine 5'-phosphate oxidase superfamily)
MRTDQRGSEILEREECLRLIESRVNGVGRVGFIDVEMLPCVLPVNFRLMGEHLVFRTGVGCAAKAVTDSQVVAFEFDEVDIETGQCWSVLVRGAASFLPDDCVRSGTELPRAYVAVPGSQLVRIATSLVSGRRFFLASSGCLHTTSTP